MPLARLTWLPAVTVSAGFLAVTFGSAKPVSNCDVSGEPLNPARVRGGMLVGWLVALQAPASGVAAPVIWACLAAAAVGPVLRSLLPDTGDR